MSWELNNRTVVTHDKVVFDLYTRWLASGRNSTVAEVAHSTGFSPSTVRVVLNGSPSVRRSGRNHRQEHTFLPSNGEIRLRINAHLAEIVRLRDEYTELAAVACDRAYTWAQHSGEAS